MSDIKKAVIIGKVDLKPRREVVVGPKADQDHRPQFQGRKQGDGAGPKREGDRPRGMKRADDSRTAQATNQAMLQELNWVKAKLRKTEEALGFAQAEIVALRTEAKALVAVLDVPVGTVVVEFADQLATLKTRLGL